MNRHTANTFLGTLGASPQTAVQNLHIGTTINQQQTPMVIPTTVNLSFPIYIQHAQPPSLSALSQIGILQPTSYGIFQAPMQLPNQIQPQLMPSSIPLQIPNLPTLLMNDIPVNQPTCGPAHARNALAASVPPKLDFNPFSVSHDQMQVQARAPAQEKAAPLKPRPKPTQDAQGMFSCHVCARKFRHKSNLKTHARIHDPDAPKCPWCGKLFGRESNLKQHLRVHTGERPFSCSQCSKKFKQLHSLKDHLRTHTGERPFSCPVCRKTFAVKHNMTVHMRIHSGEKPYVCKQCGKQYSSKSGLNSHAKKHRTMPSQQPTAQISK